MGPTAPHDTARCRQSTELAVRSPGDLRLHNFYEATMLRADWHSLKFRMEQLEMWPRSDHRIAPIWCWEYFGDPQVPKSQLVVYFVVLLVSLQVRFFAKDLFRARACAIVYFVVLLVSPQVRFFAKNLFRARACAISALSTWRQSAWRFYRSQAGLLELARQRKAESAHGPIVRRTDLARQPGNMVCFTIQTSYDACHLPLRISCSSFLLDLLSRRGALQLECLSQRGSWLENKIWCILQKIIDEVLKLMHQLVPTSNWMVSTMSLLTCSKLTPRNRNDWPESWPGPKCSGVLVFHTFSIACTNASLIRLSPEIKKAST